MTKLVNFGAGNGNYPTVGPIELNGKLYGMTTYGGAHGSGLIFEYDILLDSIRSIFDFNGTTSNIFSSYHLYHPAYCFVEAFI